MQTPPTPSNPPGPQSSDPELTPRDSTDTDYRCLECDYNLTALTTDRCPECGEEIDRTLLDFANQTQHRSGRQLRLTLISSFSGIISLVLATIAFAAARQIGFEAGAYAAATASAGCIHVILCVRYSPMGTFDRRRSYRFPLIAYTAALSQIAIPLWLILRSRSAPGSPPMGAQLFVFTIAAFPGWTLFIAAKSAFPSRRKRIGELRASYKRHSEVQFITPDSQESDKK